MLKFFIVVAYKKNPGIGPGYIRFCNAADIGKQNTMNICVNTMFINCNGLVFRNFNFLVLYFDGFLSDCFISLFICVAIMEITPTITN